MTTKQKILNFILFQALWFTCVLTGASGNWGWAYLAVIIVLSIHFTALTVNLKRDLKLVLFAVGWGIFSDSILAVLNFTGFTTDFGGALGWISPPWMVLLWVGFALTLFGCMEWMRENALLQIAFGAVGGPIAYLAGTKLGALELGPSAFYSYLAIGLMWGIAMPLLYYAGKQMSSVDD